LHSFGGHRAPITFVQLWTFEDYNNCLIDIFDLDVIITDNDDGDCDCDKEPLIVSSSLDASIRIWKISSGSCLKELYLYNPINNFQIDKSLFFVALDAGKVHVWNRLKQLCVSKCFEDDDSVCCIRYLKLNNNEYQVYALSNRGLFKILKLNLSEQNSKSELIEINESDVNESNFSITKRNFKSFEIISNQIVAVINDNKSFIILHDLINKTCIFVSTNTSSYGFTNSFYKYNNDYLFITAYNIDSSSSTINGIIFDISFNF
jgi:WD40 repeat protein